MATNGAPLYLATAGSPEYLQSILNKVGEIHPELPLDPAILQSILLCLVAGGYHESHGQCSQTNTGTKNLILRTKEEDVGMVLNIVAMILSTVFGFHTYKSRIKSPTMPSGSARRRKVIQSIAQQHPETFLRSLFFREPKPSPLIRELTGAGRDRRDSGSRNSTRRPAKRASVLTSPTDLSHDGSISALPMIGQLSDSTDEYFLENSTLASSRRPFATPASTLRSRPQAPRMQSEPSPLVSISAPSLGTARPSSHNGVNGVLPKAVVVSGLEYTNMPSQRALMQVLGNRKLTLEGENSMTGHSSGNDLAGETWNLPEDFICVYICPSNVHERPAILPSLVDKFSMSVEISVSSSTRLTYSSHRGSQVSTPIPSPFHSPVPLPSRSPLNPNASLPSSETTPTSRHSFFRAGPSLPSHARSPSTASPPVVTSTDLAQLRALASPKPIVSTNVEPNRYDLMTQFVHAHTSIHPSLDIYLSDLFAATRHHPELDGSLLTLQSHRDADDLIRAFRVIGGDTLGTDLIEASANRPPSLRVSESTDSYDHISRLGIESVGWGKEDRDILMSFEEPDVQVRVQAPDTPRQNSYGHVGADSQTRMTSSVPLTWDVSEVDIARIFPRVVSHRLSVRRGPDDEILGSAMFPAVAHDILLDDQRPSMVAIGDHAEHTLGRRSVKEILVGLLADV